MTNFKTMSENIRTQDNRITADPIFYVQEKERIWGMDRGYSDDYTWVDNEGDEIDEQFSEYLKYLDDFGYCVEDKKTVKYREILKEHGVNDLNCKKVYFIEKWINVQPFFTEMGAKEYIKINGHNLRNPRIYVVRAYRNVEWQLVREFLENYKKEL